MQIIMTGKRYLTCKGAENVAHSESDTFEAVSFCNSLSISCWSINSRVTFINFQSFLIGTRLQGHCVLAPKPPSHYYITLESIQNSATWLQICSLLRIKSYLCFCKLFSCLIYYNFKLLKCTSCSSQNIIYWFSVSSNLSFYISAHWHASHICMLVLCQLAWRHDQSWIISCSSVKKWDQSILSQDIKWQ